MWTNTGDRSGFQGVASLGGLLLALAVGAGCAQAQVTVYLSDHVLVADISRFGINLGGDNYWSGAALVKDRARENFEGTMYRQCHFGPLQDETGATTWFRDWGSWDEILPGGKLTLLSGPGKGISGKIVRVTTKKVEHQGKLKDFRYFVFDRRVPAGGANAGVLVEVNRLQDGQFRPLDGFWTSKSNRIAVGDTPPGSFGHAAALLDGTAAKAHLRFATEYQRYAETNGTWHLRFWVKTRSGSPQMRVTCDREQYGDAADVPLSAQWQQQDIKLQARAVPEPRGPDDNPMLFFRFEVSGGAVLLDDVEIWREGDENPTAFRDDLLATLEQYRPGVLRYLQMGGSTVDNTIAPPLKSFTYTSQNSAKVGPYQRHNRDPYGLHQMYELCERLGAEPWYCLPGTLTQEEMRHFIEYLGAPADVGYGKLRAQMGHPKPWTQVFKHIHVEFGNEAWNNAGPYQCGGFNGRDYWQDLIATAKASPYYTPAVVFHAGGQAANTWLTRSILRNTPNADRLALAPYIIHTFSKADAERLNTSDKLLRWAFAYAVLRSTTKEGTLVRQAEMARQAGMELSVYEVNHHITGGDGPLEPRNMLVTSLGGGLNVANAMLLMLREQHVRTQCLFSLAQHHYNAHGVGPVRLWGTALNMRSGHERYRPTFLACALANKVLGGDLVATPMTGQVPTFSAEGKFEGDKEFRTVEGLPAVFSYGFREGDRCGLILVNLDTASAHDVSVKFDGKAQGERATLWRLEAPDPMANNEFENPRPQVTLQEQALKGFVSGTKITLRPVSMVALSWRKE
ncbi:MAG: hypothetical protein J7M26_09585 [Armatimonadetes bacterium]|nr:hypothetical protein [Armatimonadota bacterium]